MSAVGRSLELFYIDGRPDGRVTAELFNWTGHVLMTPRTQISEALAREEAGYAGVYLLLGEKDGEPLAYIGEAEDVGTRIRQHSSQKDWWTKAVLVTAAANRLNKAHVRYLEAQLIGEARKVGRVELENATVLTKPSLNEADIAKMKAFLENLLVVLPAVRVDMFIRRVRSTQPPVTVFLPSNGPSMSGQSDSDATRFELESRKHNLRATAVLSDGEFIVEEGSTARLIWNGSPTHTYSQLHRELLRANVLLRVDDHCVFAQSYAFSSSSAAAAVIFGRTANGPLAWRVAGQTITYRDWEAAQLLRSTAGPA